MEPNPIVEKRYNRRWKTKKPKNQMKKEKGGKELTWPNTIHQSVFYLHARNIRGRNSEPPWIPSVPTPSILPSFLLSFLSFHASPPPPPFFFALENEISCSIAIHAVPTQFSFIECGSDVKRGSRVRMFASLNRPTSMTSRNPSSASVD